MEPSIFTFLIFCICAAVATGCVSSFSGLQSRVYFDVCLKKDCILFKEQPPYIFTSPKIQDDLQQRPFPCANYRDQRPGRFDGPLFKIIERIRPLEDAQCVWVGSNCSFDSMLDFMKNSAAVGDKHRWIVGSILFVLPYRISQDTIPSTSLLEEEIRIIGPPVQDHTTPAEAWKALMKPFTGKGWGYIFGCTIGHLLVRAIMVYIFCKLDEGESENGESFGWTRFSDFESAYEKGEEEKPLEKWWRRMNRFWLVIATIFTVSTMMFWEVAIAVQVYEARLEAPLENIEPARFAILRNSSLEDVFKGLVKQKGRGGNDNDSDVPWTQYNLNQEGYKYLLDDTNDIDFSVRYEVFNRFEMNSKPEICNHLRVYEDVPSQLVDTRKPPTLSGAMFYSSQVPVARRVEIDKGLAYNKKKGHILEIIDQAAGEDLLDACKLKSNRIDWVLLGLLHAAIIGLPFSVYSLYMAVFSVRYCYLLHKNATGGDKDADAAVGVTDSSASDLLENG